jgi:hypothetical protein
MENYIVSEFAVVNNPVPSGRKLLTEILADIKNGKHKEKVELCRTALDDKQTLEFYKRKLSLFTPTGLFTYRSIAKMQSYNGLICLDIDHIDDPEHLKTKCKNLSYVYAAFITPSGKGLKVLIKSKATPETYKAVELEIAAAFQIDTGAVRDNNCKDIARIQYVSYDPELFINENSKIF